MRSAQKSNRARGRGNRKGNGGGANLNRVYESNGPEGKVRGTPQQIIEKYLTLARDAQTAGDRVNAENFLQHAEHYQRILAAALGAQAEQRQQNERQPDDSEDEGEAEARQQGQNEPRGGQERQARESSGRGEKRQRRDGEQNGRAKAAEAEQQPAGMQMIEAEDAEDDGLIVTPEEVAATRTRKRRSNGNGNGASRQAGEDEGGEKGEQAAE